MIRLFAFGALFGFVLSRVGATDYDAIAGMFLLTDFHLVGVIGIAVGVAAIGFALLRRTPAGAPPGKPMKPGLIAGAALFGAGWAITGTCPGTGLAQVGEGKWIALFTVAGLFAGTALYRAVGPALERRLAALREPPSQRAIPAIAPARTGRRSRA